MIVKPSLERIYDHYGLSIIGSGHQSWRKAECPLPSHVDNNPSASVNTELNIWRCHACSEGGDGFDIVKAREDVTPGFNALKRRTAEIAGGSDGPVRPGPSSSSLLSGRPRGERTDRHFVPAWRRL